MNKYTTRRDFSKTPEPKTKEKKQQLKNVFLVQEHAASSHHYDFRLEIDGKLKSWAIPKGPSLNPKLKRLAIITENHPLSYYEFEGIIPKSEYGAGKVLIWDRGKYKNLRKATMSTAFKQGKIELCLEEKMLKGKFVLIRTKRKSQKNNQNDWLLIKVQDEYANTRTNITNTHTASVVSNKKIQEL